MKDYPTICGLFKDGYGLDMAQALADGIQNYVRAMENDCPGERDTTNIYNLLWLMKAILKDCCGVEMS